MACTHRTRRLVAAAALVVATLSLSIPTLGFLTSPGPRDRGAGISTSPGGRADTHLVARKAGGRPLEYF